MATTEQISQREQAYQQLRRLLILQQIPEGERLTETAWAKRLGVSRGALREAFARLEAEGFIAPGARSGYNVAHLTEDDIREVLEVRIMLEGGAVERIVRMGYNKVGRLKAMIESCGQLERLIHEDYLLGVTEADRRFHEALVEVAGNQRLIRLYQRAPLPIIHPVLLAGEQWIARLTQTLQEHRMLVDAILAGDVAQGQSLLRTHLNERAFIPLHAG